METASKYGGVMRYTFWPYLMLVTPKDTSADTVKLTGLGKSPIIDIATNEPIAPLSSFPGSPAFLQD